MAQGTPVAQSGGKNSTFGGGKGGTKESKTSTKDRVIGKGKNARGLTVTARSETGDKALVRGSGRAAKAGKLSTTGGAGRARKQPSSLGKKGGFGGGGNG